MRSVSCWPANEASGQILGGRARADRDRMLARLHQLAVGGRDLGLEPGRQRRLDDPAAGSRHRSARVPRRRRDRARQACVDAGGETVAGEETRGTPRRWSRSRRGRGSRARRGCRSSRRATRSCRRPAECRRCAGPPAAPRISLAVMSRPLRLPTCRGNRYFTALISRRSNSLPRTQWPIRHAPSSSSPTAPASRPRRSVTACSRSSRASTSSRSSSRSSIRSTKAEECVDADRRRRRPAPVRGRSSSARWSTTTSATSCAAPTRWCSISSKASSNPLEAELGTRSSHTVGRSHGVANNQEYSGPHRGDQLRARARRRPGQPRARQGRRDPGRRLAQRQDADLPLPGAAARHQGRELSADAGRLRPRHAAGRGRAAPQDALRAHDRAGAPGRDPQRAPSGQPLRAARELPLRGRRRPRS